jgi:hypothetical protein
MVRARTKASGTLTVPTRKGGRILGFDIENMPLTYYAPDYPTAQITAIASAFEDDVKGTIHVCLLGICDPEEMLTIFVNRYEEADIVTGHYIRKHDLPIINGSLIEFGMPTLSKKMTSDTKMDLVKFSDIPKNQEYLGAIMGTKQPKVPMTQADWRQANRFTPEGIERTRKRVVADVRQQLQMRKELIRRGLLREPQIWRP